MSGRWVEPVLQQISVAQFGSGANPGGHVTISLYVIGVYVDGPLIYFHTHLPHPRVCASVTRCPSPTQVGPDTALASGLHGIAVTVLWKEKNPN